MTILEAINLSTEYLQKKGVESPKTNAEILLADILKIKRLDLYLSFDKPLDETEIEIYRSYLKRRANYEPLQYITGKVNFCGIELSVDKSVLIPRPETEILIEKILESVDKEMQLHILDIGTGCGNIAIALAKNLSSSLITAIDISNSAIITAKKNAIKNKVENQIQFIEKDINSKNSFYQKYDLIVSNPPYVSKEEYNTLQKEILNFEPQIAVTDYEDGYKFYSSIIESAKFLLNKNGKLFFELGHHHLEKIKNILKENNFVNIQFWKDYQNIPRVIKGELI